MSLRSTDGLKHSSDKLSCSNWVIHVRTLRLFRRELLTADEYFIVNTKAWKEDEKLTTIVLKATSDLHAH